VLRLARQPFDSRSRFPPRLLVSRYENEMLGEFNIYSLRRWKMHASLAVRVVTAITSGSGAL